MLENRTTKSGKKIKAEVKSFIAFAKVDMMAGKLNKRGEVGKFIANIVPKKQIKAGDQVHLRIAYGKSNGNYLVYIHGLGWTETSNLNNSFETRGNKDLNKLIFKTFNELDTVEKTKILISQQKIENPTKTEQMLIAYLNGKDLNEMEKEIGCDKSLKYKIKNHTEKFATTFINKYSNIQNEIA